MNDMKRIHTIIGIALLMLMAACDKGQEAVHVSEITLNSQALTLVVGDSEVGKSNIIYSTTKDNSSSFLQSNKKTSKKLTN